MFRRRQHRDCRALVLPVLGQGLRSVRLVVCRASSSYDVGVVKLLDPPAVVFRPGRKEQLHKFHKYGRMFKAYDLIRVRTVSLPTGDVGVHCLIDIVTLRLWVYP